MRARACGHACILGMGSQFHDMRGDCQILLLFLSVAFYNVHLQPLCSCSIDAHILHCVTTSNFSLCRVYD